MKKKNSNSVKLWNLNKSGNKIERLFRIARFDYDRCSCQVGLIVKGVFVACAVATPGSNGKNSVPLLVSSQSWPDTPHSLPPVTSISLHWAAIRFFFNPKRFFFIIRIRTLIWLWLNRGNRAAGPDWTGIFQRNYWKNFFFLFSCELESFRLELSFNFSATNVRFVLESWKLAISRFH